MFRFTSILVSLSSADYTCIRDLVSDLLKDSSGAKVSLPSLRVDSFSVGLAEMLGGATKSGLTLAPEAGSQRMRDIINKRVTEGEIYEAAEHAFSAGYSHIKLYFMVGLPGETDEDVLAIGKLAQSIRKLGRDMGKRPTIVVSVSGFVPKAHTPFQWEACLTPDELMRRQRLLRSVLRGPGLEYRYHDAYLTRLEAVFARGDRRLSRALELAYRSGRRFDAWTDDQNQEQWDHIFQESGVDVEFYAHRERSSDEVFPWDHLQSGVRRASSLQRRLAMKGRHSRIAGGRTARMRGVPDLGVKSTWPLSGRSPLKVRVIYEKGDQVRFLGHLDVARIVQMSVRCAGWPVKMSEGFSPKPKMDFGSPLPVGVAGYNEVFEEVLTEDRPLEWLARTLSASIPRGFRIREILPVLSERASLSDSIVASVYDLDLKGVDRALCPGHLTRLWRTNQFCLRSRAPKMEGKLTSGRLFWKWKF